jgi:hypothetical protein
MLLKSKVVFDYTGILFIVVGMGLGLGLVLDREQSRHDTINQEQTTDALTNLKTKAPNDDSVGVKTGQSTLYQYHSYGQAKKNHHHHHLLLLLLLDSFLLKMPP